MSGREDDSKEFEPTPHRLEEARRRGEVPRSLDLTAAAALGGLWLALAVAGGWMAGRGGAALAQMLAEAPHLAARPLGGGGLPRGSMAALLAALLPLAALPAALVLAVLAAQRGLTFTGGNLAVRLDRIDPVKTFGRKFGPDGLVEFLKGAVKMALISVILFLFLHGRLPALVATAGAPERAGLAALAAMLSAFLALSVLIGVAIGGVDYLWQRHRHRAGLRMSRQDMKEEMRQHEGDPQLKHRRRQRGQDIATNRMLQDVPRADVVIVNPTHYAVALRWERLPGRAPVCVAKGTDAVAARIRELAMAAGVPIRPDPPTARALHATVEVGQQIRPDHYRTVAAAIRFAEAMRQRARTGG